MKAKIGNRFISKMMMRECEIADTRTVYTAEGDPVMLYQMLPDGSFVSEEELRMAFWACDPPDDDDTD